MSLSDIINSSAVKEHVRQLFDTSRLPANHPARRAPRPAWADRILGSTAPVPPTSPAPAPAPAPAPGLGDERTIRADERRRIRAIFLSDAGKADPDLAAHVALDSDLGVSAAVSMIATLAATRTRSQADCEPDLAAFVILAGKKRRGEVEVAPPKPTSRLARDVLAAAKKARGES